MVTLMVKIQFETCNIYLVVLFVVDVTIDNRVKG